MKKAVIFDFGGTLDTNGVHWSEKFLDAYREYGLNFTSEQYNYAYVKADEELKRKAVSINDYKTLLLEQSCLHLKFICGKSYDDEKIKKLAVEINSKIMDGVNACIGKSKELFGVLKNEYLLGIVSNFYGNLERICDDIGFKDYADVMIDSETAGIEKPHPGIFSLALQKLGVMPEDTFVVGDSYERDIVPSKILGCRTIWLKNKSFRDSANTDSADYTVSNLGDILRYLT